ncbi:MAG: STN and carboxypeptidase regulatory-like domain-containing protein [Salinivirgaceae bacterium]
MQKKLPISVFLLLWVLFTIQGRAQSVSKAADYLSMPVSLDITSQSLDKVLDKLSTQYNCYFTYDARQIDGDRKVTMACNAWPLKKVLDSLLNNPVFSYEIINNQVVIHPITTSRTKAADTDEKYLILKGKIVHQLTSKPLPFASIALKNTYLGGISNENGSFNLKIPAKYKNDTLVFSYLGFTNRQVALANFPDSGIIALNEAVVPLQEVMVRSKDPLFLLKKARSVIDQTHQQKAYAFEAFYRESIQTNKRYVVYSEALINGYMPEKSRSFSNQRVELIKTRNFTDIRQEDTVMVKLRGGMDACFQLDIVRQFPDFLSDEGLWLYHYQLIDMVAWQNQLVYVIGFKQRKEASEAQFEGLLYISSSDYAILGAEFYFEPNKLNRSMNLFVVRKSNAIKVKPTQTHYRVSYVQVNGKYYPQHVQGELQVKVRKRRELFTKSFTTAMELFYTHYTQEEINKVPRRDMFQTTSVFSDAMERYDNGFWKNQTIIVPEADILEAFKKSGFKIQEQGQNP